MLSFGFAAMILETIDNHLAQAYDVHFNWRKNRAESPLPHESHLYCLFVSLIERHILSKEMPGFYLNGSKMCSLCSGALTKASPENLALWATGVSPFPTKQRGMGGRANGEHNHSSSLS